MRNELEAEKRKTAQEKARGERYAKIIVAARKAYRCLYKACEQIGKAQDDAMRENCPAWFNVLVQQTYDAMADAELASPFAFEGQEGYLATYCRTCGRPITATASNEAYCETCSRSSKKQTEPIDGGEDHADDNAI